jgi:putative addiction module component (TIGR02574 family)
MSEQATRLLVEALNLPESERGDIAAGLIESLDSTSETGVDAAWSWEIRERLEDIQSGRVKPIPWSEARRMILDDRDDPPDH